MQQKGELPDKTLGLLKAGLLLKEGIGLAYDERRLIRVVGVRLLEDVDCEKSQVNFIYIACKRELLESWYDGSIVELRTVDTSLDASACLRVPAAV